MKYFAAAEELRNDRNRWKLEEKRILVDRTETEMRKEGKRKRNRERRRERERETTREREREKGRKGRRENGRGRGRKKKRGKGEKGGIWRFAANGRDTD